MALGITLIAITCFLALGIAAIANKNIREYDESKHESYIGS